MFENKIINGVHATRYIMSWIKSGGDLKYGGGIEGFNEWLTSLGLTIEEVTYIRNLAQNGRLELEYSAKQFLAKK